MSSHSFVKHLEAAVDGSVLPARTVQTVYKDRPIRVCYDLEAIRGAVHRDELCDRPRTMWRYRELLPHERHEDRVSLSETMTPLVRCERLARQFGVRELIIKDESRLPTGSFKARGMAMAVTMAKELGLRRLAAPTAGNAGGALAAYAARAGLECFIFMPEDTPIINQRETAHFGARAFLVNGLISDCGRLVREGADAMGWFDMSTLREPYRLEGKKTMGLELAEQLNWELPGAIFYPTGGGTGLIGMWKAFDELEALGWLKRSERPRLFACQSDGCCPIVRAFDTGARFAESFQNARTIASGLRVPAAVGDFLILDAVRASNGRAMAADESRLGEWMRRAGAMEGLSLCPEAAACLDVLEPALREGFIDPDRPIVLFNTGSVQKYVDAMESPLARLDCTRSIDWAQLA